MSPYVPISRQSADMEVLAGIFDKPYTTIQSWWQRGILDGAYECHRSGGPLFNRRKAIAIVEKRGVAAVDPDFEPDRGGSHD